MSNRGAIFQGIGVGNPISFAEMNAAQANRQRLELQREENKQRNFERGEARKAATAQYLSNALEKKDFLSGSPYDPMIIQGLDNAMKQGMALAQKGADTPSIMMAIGPLVGKLNEYQAKAKLIESNAKSSVDKLGQFPGFNKDGLLDTTKKIAYFNPDGSLKDISEVDPNVDYTSAALKAHPELTTTSAWLDELVNKTPMAKSGQVIKTEHMGRTKDYEYNIEKPYWMDVAKDENGKVLTDPKTGAPLGLDVKSHILRDKEGKPMVDTETNQPFRVIEDAEFRGMMSRNPAAAYNLDAQVRKHFMDAGAKDSPSIGSPEWENMAKHILYQELKMRDRSDFKKKDIQTNAPIVDRIEVTGSAFAPRSGSGSSSDVQVNDVYKSILENPHVAQNEAVRLNQLSATEQNVILSHARDLTKDDKLNQDDIYVRKDENDNLGIYDRPTGKLISTLDAKDVNLKTNKTVKPQQEIIKENKYENTRSGTYRGKKITIGMKNGKWYNTKTGEELK